MIEGMNVDMIAMKKETTTTTGEDPRLLTTAEDRTGQDHALALTLLVIIEVKFSSSLEDDYNIVDDVDVYFWWHESRCTFPSIFLPKGFMCL